MAYGNWGAFVYKDGERQPKREDNTPYCEDELEPGYYQAFGGNDENGERIITGKKLGVHHATMGHGKFRLCGYKSYPVIFLEGKEIDINQFAKDENKGSKDWWTC